ncbi:MAG TPA: twin-arginine translocase TatA/TatE family subunit [Acidobacteriaceae bacterium]|jgi:sec-independent protein translocase protein TatB|nr:twin-arginine translocase TatA/TatE family subunit [Acidobacteriaceae bacterium]
MHFGDSIFIFLLALVLFGPKKLPEIGRTIGKLLAEFRRASNEFKFQIQDELRNMEDEERRKKLAEQQAQAKANEPALPADTTSTAEITPSILPPSTGTPVSASAPYATPVEPGDPSPSSLTVTPAATEIVVELPPPATVSSAPEAVPESPDKVDQSAPTNGAHPAEPIEPAVPREPVRHG